MYKGKHKIRKKKEDEYGSVSLPLASASLGSQQPVTSTPDILKFIDELEPTWKSKPTSWNDLFGEPSPSLPSPSLPSPPLLSPPLPSPPPPSPPRPSQLPPSQPPLKEVRFDDLEEEEGLITTEETDNGNGRQIDKRRDDDGASDNDSDDDDDSGDDDDDDGDDDDDDGDDDDDDDDDSGDDDDDDENDDDDNQDDETKKKKEDDSGEGGYGLLGGGLEAVPFLKWFMKAWTSYYVSKGIETALPTIPVIAGLALLNKKNNKKTNGDFVKSVETRKKYEDFVNYDTIERLLALGLITGGAGSILKKIDENNKK